MSQLRYFEQTAEEEEEAAGPLPKAELSLCLSQQ
jgi:hypothetical protein